MRISASTWLPNDELFWCAGAQGTMYPLTGSVGEYIGGVQGTVLLSERLIYKLHRLGLMADSSIGDLCSAHTTMTLPKSRYRYQMINPIPTVTPNGCQPFGRTTMLWGVGLGITDQYRKLRLFDLSKAKLLLFLICDYSTLSGGKRTWIHY